MSDIAPIGRSSVTGPSPSGRGAQAAVTVPPPSRGSDRVELSHAAQLLSKLHELPDVRQDLVDRVKGEIADGHYETDDKIELALDNLQSDLA